MPILADHAFGDITVPLRDAKDCLGDLFLDLTTQFQNQIVKLRQFLFVGRYRMRPGKILIGHDLTPVAVQPKRPVM